MIVVSGTLRLEPRTLDELRELARETIRATRLEEGCIVYSFAEDLTEPGLVRIYEEWASMAALAAHGRTAHIVRWREALGAVPFEQELKTVEAGATAPLR